MRMESGQTLIVVDSNDSFIRYAPRYRCHTGTGLRHRAIAILLYNGKQQILLQKRRHKIFNNLWDLSGATHPLHTRGRDESYEESCARCLQSEWGIQASLRKLLAFAFFARDGRFCENEFCILFVGRYDGLLSPNKKHVKSHRWIKWSRLLSELGNHADEFTPWLKAAVESLKNNRKQSLAVALKGN